MKTYPKYIKYFILLPILFIQFSCEDSTSSGCSGTCNGDVIGSWKLTALTGTYLYTVNLPDGNESGVTWANTDTTFGIQARWDGADAKFVGDYAPFTEYGNTWLVGVQQGDAIPGVSTTSSYTSEELQAASMGLIGVFEDAPSAGNYATYKMGGIYPSIAYNYTNCATGLETPRMKDQGIYTWDQTASEENFAIKRDPSIGGTQVLPPFDDGTLTVTGDLLNIQF